ncbi:unnamed protein product [Rotaria sp. Silwood1]|nr:unnamed protein product [Rotaria sp. Silwood1]CAF1285752.1 unnamed protein product [Rotaria sp. Silwood1]CAF1290286.1 unnamed protein product [Rotaria sp. Silwood1]CAF3463827.1 unnamed protein product [Rotaria sp. Silwood1]CAF3511234.1 unnamed protein product [Rotaria sp. Silwood1]
MTMELDDCITKDCSTIYRFQFASIAFICGIYLPYTFHSNIWSLYSQPFTSVNCTTIKNPFILGITNNIPTKPLATILTNNNHNNRSDCCPCNGLLNGNINDKRLVTLCQEWMKTINQLDVRKATIIDEWHLACGKENRKSLMLGSISFLIAEIIGVITIGILADQYGRKLLLLMCLYIPVLFGSLAAFTTTYSLFIILRWPVGFLNKGLLLLGFVMVIESCEYKHRAQIGCLLLASMPIFGIIVGVTYFFLLDWRHMQLLGTLITTLTLCYPWLIPESRRWYVNSHRVSRVNKLLQLCSTKQSPKLGLNKIGSPAPTTMVYDKPILSQNSLRVQTGSISCLIMEQQLRTITGCLFILWFISSFCYRCTFFPSILPHPTINYVLMNAIEFFSFIIALVVAYRIGRRPPLAVLILISGLSSVSLAITLLGTGHIWLEIIFSLLARSCLRTCYCILILFTSELYPTSVRATGLAIGLTGEVLSKIFVEVLLYFLIDRTLLLFISGGMLCLSCCLIIPLPETILYDLPDSLNDLKSMKRSTSSDTDGDISISSQRHHIIDSNTLLREPRTNTAITSDFNDLSSPPQLQQHAPTPKTILRSQQQSNNSGNGKTVTIHSQPEIIQLQSNTSSLNGLSNPCYFASVNDTIDQYDIEQHIDNTVVISIRGAQTSTNNNNNNNNCEDHQAEATKF